MPRLSRGFFSAAGFTLASLVLYLGGIFLREVARFVDPVAAAYRNHPGFIISSRFISDSGDTDLEKT